MESFTLGLMRGDGAPLYRQLYRHIVEEIASGGLAAGEKLPSKRRLAADLRVSVSTVETAYQMLVAEGYIAARAKSGFTVCRIEKLDAPVRPAPAAPPEPPAKRWAYDFGTGSVDTALFPFKTWARIQRETVTAHPELLNHGSRQGDASLRAAIAKYLHAYRGVVCAPEQIVVGAGIEYLVGLLARLFCASTFAVENPGYPRTAQVLRNNGVRTVFVPVDGDGMTLDALQAGGAQLAYVTPSHQFPTGATMPIARRTELLRWAGAAPGRYVVEDDYDSEFRYDTRPIPSLQGLDQAGRVVSQLTNYPSFALSSGLSRMTIRRFDLLMVERNAFIIVVMTDTDIVRNRLIRLPSDLTEAQLQMLNTLLNTTFTGLTLEEITPELMRVAQHAAGEAYGLISLVVSFAMEVLESLEQRTVHTSGLAHLLELPEYRSLERAQPLMSYLSEDADPARFPVPKDDPMKILIGPENVADALKDTSVVVASYDIGDGMRGVIGVVGPTRMDYAKITARLSYLAEGLSRLFGQGELPQGRDDEK